MIYVESFLTVYGQVRWRAVDLETGRMAVGDSPEEAKEVLLEVLGKSPPKDTHSEPRPG